MWQEFLLLFHRGRKFMKLGFARWEFKSKPQETLAFSQQRPGSGQSLPLQTWSKALASWGGSEMRGGLVNS
jgi:hypothetical protein